MKTKTNLKSGATFSSLSITKQIDAASNKF
jgi:hypothetical protein